MELLDGGRRLALLNFAFERIAQALYLIDEEAGFQYVNQEACRALGYSREELVCMSVFDIDPDITQERWLEFWQITLLGQSRSFRTRHKSKDGRIFPVEINVSYFEFDGQHYNLALAQDITERLRNEDELHLREQAFRALAENSPDTIARYDGECRRLYVNSALAGIFGMPAEELLGKTPVELLPTQSAHEFEGILCGVYHSGEGRSFERSWQNLDKRVITHHFCLTPEFDADGKVISVLSVGRDISSVNENELRLQQAETMARIGHWQWNCALEESLVSAGLCHILGQPLDWKPTLEDLLGLIVADDQDRVIRATQDAFSRHEVVTDYGYRVKSGDRLLFLHTRVHIEYAPDGSPSRLIGTTHDISDMKNFESRLHEMEFHDVLTGLPNRALFNDRLHQALVEATRHGHTLGLLVLDLDRFKEINDTRGHVTGDRILHQSAQRLIDLVRDYDTVARLGGDEFAVILPDVRDAADLGGISRKLLDALERPFLIDSHELFISASIGIAVFPSDGRSADELLQYADSALYDAKDRGRAGFRFYSSELTAKSKERSTVEAALRYAETREELALHYQPKVDLTDGRLVGAEALLRWNHPELGQVAPERFIGIAEDTGLIVSMGVWVLASACRTARRWNERADRNGGQALKVAVNLSSRQFRDDDLAATVKRVLDDTGCDPRWLELEITESLLLDDNDGIRASLQALRDHGITIAIDDFGTGFSALGYLRRFPIDVLKIDRSFTSEVMLNRDSAELVKTIITMAQSLRLGLVAEGVETEGQQRFLLENGCQLGQGYYFGKPMPVEDFDAHLLACRRPATAVG